MCVKQLLRELGFPFNGSSASFTSILIATRAFLHGNGAGVGRGNGLRSDASLSAFSGHPAELKADQGYGENGSPSKSNGKKIVFMLRDLFYSTRKNLFELFRQGDSSRKKLDFAAFTAIVDFSSKGTVPPSASETAFVHLVHSASGDMSFESFERAFRSEVPTG
jgi:curved DNA-binding protein CbpA